MLLSIMKSHYVPVGKRKQIMDMTLNTGTVDILPTRRLFPSLNLSIQFRCITQCCIPFHSVPDRGHKQRFSYCLPRFLLLFTEANNLSFYLSCQDLAQLPRSVRRSPSLSLSLRLSLSLPFLTLSRCNARKPLSQTPPRLAHTASIMYRPKIEE